MTYFITSQEMREREALVVKSMHSQIDPVTGYGHFHRSAEHRIPGMLTTYNLNTNGYPDLVISGTHSAKHAQHKWVLNNCAVHILSNLKLESKIDYVGVLNKYLSDMGLSNSYQAVHISTEPFLNGYAMNIGRFYGDMPRADQMYIQLVEVGPTGAFPVSSLIDQVVFDAVPTSPKEQSNE